ncbi:hypothetical protein FPZ12_001725 [Amycolatopsis acidicola]|uniref:Uncharacterized protein n=1 Tax=Amycolatopsis acidicola TaxID=2596893 RepID=A0A5N0VNE2_9PSEU|nr:hypothetical protein [Amycolatopsis acidicola]KAA9166312.1 hypothetical protein FPZ12_001725 [Amycolatopsis acidicola]
MSEISGYDIGAGDYVSYFVNEHGEPMVFVRETGLKPAILLHADLGWEPQLVEGPPRKGTADRSLSPGVRRMMADVPVMGDVILNEAEARWLRSCLAASERW